MGGAGGGSTCDGATARPRPRHRRRSERRDAADANADANAAPLLLIPLLLLVLAAAAPRPCDAGIHVSHVMQDGRALIPLTPNFGFDPRGGGSVIATVQAPVIVYRPHAGGNAAPGLEVAPPNR